MGKEGRNRNWNRSDSNRCDFKSLAGWIWHCYWFWHLRDGFWIKVSGETLGEIFFPLVTRPTIERRNCRIWEAGFRSHAAECLRFCVSSLQQVLTMQTLPQNPPAEPQRLRRIQRKRGSPDTSLRTGFFPLNDNRTQKLTPQLALAKRNWLEPTLPDSGPDRSYKLRACPSLPRTVWTTPTTLAHTSERPA